MTALNLLGVILVVLILAAVGWGIERVTKGLRK